MDSTSKRNLAIIIAVCLVLFVGSVMLISAVHEEAVVPVTTTQANEPAATAQASLTIQPQAPAGS